MTYIKERIYKLFSGDIDDVLSILPANKLSASQSREKIRKINELLKKSSAVFNPNKPALEKLGVTLYKSKNGLCVDFSKTPKYLYGNKVNSKSVVKIKLKGSRELDNLTAWKKTGFSEEQIKLIREDYTWHHLDDFNPVTGQGTLQLVEKEIHRQCSPHIGSVKQIEGFFGILYKN
ncbi:MAG: HNH endonuclease [Bacteroidia bacterium]|nr:HNH endonuclease [Bacteroidia bacterium]